MPLPDHDSEKVGSGGCEHGSPLERTLTAQVQNLDLDGCRNKSLQLNCSLRARQRYLDVGRAVGGDFKQALVVRHYLDDL